MKPRLRLTPGGIWVCTGRDMAGLLFMGHGYSPLQAWNDWIAQVWAAWQMNLWGNHA